MLVQIASKQTKAKRLNATRGLCVPSGLDAFLQTFGERDKGDVKRGGKRAEERRWRGLTQREFSDGETDKLLLATKMPT